MNSIGSTDTIELCSVVRYVTASSKLGPLFEA
jgi:hypothetical protein